MAFTGGAGALDRLITLERIVDPGATADSFGETLSEPVDDIDSIRACYERAGGREFPESEKRQAETTGRFRIRYRPDINVLTVVETHQVRYVEDYNASPPVARYYDIQHAAVMGRRDEIHFHVSEVR